MSFGAGPFATFEESEYIPSLVFAIAVTAWAIQRGHKVQPISSLYPPLLTGCGWFSFGVETTRIIPGVATFQSSGSVVLDSSKIFAEDRIHIGNGHFSHRWQCTEWQNPFIAGHNCSEVIKYSQWIGDCGLHHKVLVWDCPSHQLCQVMPSLQLPGNLLR